LSELREDPTRVGNSTLGMVNDFMRDVRAMGRRQ
jgi:hypothetical protein